MALRLLLALTLAYLLGSVSFAYLFVKLLAGKDLTREGTGNLGGRNVSRTLGKGMATVVIALDMLKGAAAVVVGMRMLDGAPWLSFVLMGAVLMGHNYSIFMGMKGGKGLASAFGALTVINPAILAILISGGLITLALTRDVYKAALAMIFLLIPVTIFLFPAQTTVWTASIIPTLVVLSRHVRHL